MKRVRKARAAGNLPDSPGFYPCIVAEMRRGLRQTPAIVEVCGETPYLRAFLYAGGDAREIGKLDLDRLQIGERLSLVETQ